MECSTCLYLGGRRGFGGAAPNKLKSSGEGRDANEVSEPCRRHGLKLVLIVIERGGSVTKLDLPKRPFFGAVLK
jgi:hypothetical protein